MNKIKIGKALIAFQILGNLLLAILNGTIWTLLSIIIYYAGYNFLIFIGIALIYSGYKECGYINKEIRQEKENKPNFWEFEHNKSNFMFIVFAISVVLLVFIVYLRIFGIIY